MTANFLATILKFPLVLLQAKAVRVEVLNFLKDVLNVKFPLVLLQAKAVRTRVLGILQ